VDLNRLLLYPEYEAFMELKVQVGTFSILNNKKNSK